MKFDKLLEKKNQWLILLLVGLLAVVIALPSGEEQRDVQETETAVPAQTWEDGELEILERKLCGALESVDGVGKAEVMITMEATGKKTVEKDAQTTVRISGVTDQTSGTSSTEQSDSASTVYELDQDGSQTPYVTQETSMTIRGVLVVAQGGGDPVIVQNITEAVMALFGIEAHKIKVMKMS